MYTNSKYVTGTIDGFDVAIVFPEIVGHNQISIVLDGRKANSAGFCFISDEAIECYGESISLKLKANPEIDNKLVARAVAHRSGVI